MREMPIRKNVWSEAFQWNKTELFVNSKYFVIRIL